MRNRWYDPNSGRFTQEDPIGYAGGINLYAYVGNDPVGYSDPYGLCGGPGEPPCKEATWAVVGATGGAAIAVGGCTLSTGGACALAMPAVAALGGSGGALVGGFAGKVADNKDAIATAVASIGEDASAASRKVMNVLAGIVAAYNTVVGGMGPQCEGPTGGPKIEVQRDVENPPKPLPDLDPVTKLEGEQPVDTSKTRQTGCNK